MDAFIKTLMKLRNTNKNSSLVSDVFLLKHVIKHSYKYLRLFT